MATTKIVTQLAVDDPLVQDANYRFDATDRQYIDSQILGLEQHLVNCLIKGKQATYLLVDTTSPALLAGNVVCAYGVLNNETTVGLATTAPVAAAGSAIGIVLVAANPGSYALVSFAGIVPPVVTGFSTGAVGYAVLNQTTGRLNVAATYANSDIVIGKVDQFGNTFVYQVPASQTGVVVPGGTGTQLQYRASPTTFGGAANLSYDTVNGGLVVAAGGFVSIGTAATAGSVRLPNAGTIYGLGPGAANAMLIRYGNGGGYLLEIGETGNVGETRLSATSGGGGALTGYLGSNLVFNFATTGTTLNSPGGSMNLNCTGGTINLQSAVGYAINIAVGTTTYIYASGATAAVEFSKTVGGLVVSPDTIGLRLTLTSGVPVTTGNVSSSTIYLTPFRSGSIALYGPSAYSGNVWYRRDTAEVSLALSGYLAGSIYDIFAYWNGSAVVLEPGPAWTNATTRSAAVVRQDGVWVKSTDPTRRLVGTIRASSSTTVTDSVTARYLANSDPTMQVAREMYVTDTTASWASTTAAWRQANGSAANTLGYVSSFGDQVVDASARLHGASATVNTFYAAGVGIDSTTANSAGHTGMFVAVANATSFDQATYRGRPGIGFHAINWLEFGGTGVSFIGSVPPRNCGLYATVMA